MPSKTIRALVYLVFSYWLVSLGGTLLNHIPGLAGVSGASPTESPAFRAGAPFQPLLNLVVFPCFAWFYLRALPAEVKPGREALRLGIFWGIVSMLGDLAGWVLVPGPFQMSLKQFYVDNQPWLSLAYAAIFVSPLIAVRFVRQRQVAGKPKVNRKKK